MGMQEGVLDAEVVGESAKERGDDGSADVADGDDAGAFAGEGAELGDAEGEDVGVHDGVRDAAEDQGGDGDAGRG